MSLLLGNIDVNIEDSIIIDIDSDKVALENRKYLVNMGADMNKV